jgi:DNA-binding response OmpR family regulator
MSKDWILVIEDDAALRNSVVDLLTLEGYLCRAVEDGNKAFDILHKTAYLPKVVLLDLMMPHCTGYEFLQRLHNNKRFDTIPLIILSAAKDAKETAKAYQAGFIRKPVDVEVLLKTIAKYALSKSR